MPPSRIDRSEGSRAKGIPAVCKRAPSRQNPPPPRPLSQADSLGLALEPQGVRSKPMGPVSSVVRGSRWVDYDTHELLEMIGRPRGRAPLVAPARGILARPSLSHPSSSRPSPGFRHTSSKCPRSPSPFDVIKQRKLTSLYLDLPPDALRETPSEDRAQAAPSLTGRSSIKRLSKDMQSAGRRQQPAPPASAVSRRRRRQRR